MEIQRETFEPRPHQQAVIDKATEGFKTPDRGKLIMACGIGKTFTVLRPTKVFARGSEQPLLWSTTFSSSSSMVNPV